MDNFGYLWSILWSKRTDSINQIITLLLTTSSYLHRSLAEFSIMISLPTLIQRTVPQEIMNGQNWDFLRSGAMKRTTTMVPQMLLPCWEFRWWPGGLLLLCSKDRFKKYSTIHSFITITCFLFSKYVSVCPKTKPKLSDNIHIYASWMFNFFHLLVHPSIKLST